MTTRKEIDVGSLVSHIDYKNSRCIYMGIVVKYDKCYHCVFCLKTKQFFYASTCYNAFYYYKLLC